MVRDAQCAWIKTPANYQAVFMGASYLVKREQALVIGASFSGLLAARVLSNHFDQVTIIEKDQVHRWPECRKGQPHTCHIHGLLPSGLHILSHYFPDILDAIVQQGGQVLDFVQSMNWFSYGGFKKPFNLGLVGALVSRPMLEHLVREKVLALTNVRLLDQTTARLLIASADQRVIRGITIRQKNAQETLSLFADLVVDASGRGSRTPQWLEALGYEAVPVKEVRVNVGYTTRLYERSPEDERGKSWMICTPRAPQEKRFGAAIPIEGNRWIVTVGGWHDDHAPAEEGSYQAFVKSLPNPNIYDIIKDNKPITPFFQYKFPVSTLRHYEKLRRLPIGYLLLGDAIASFNPIYGQGMSSACLQAAALDKVLQEKVAGDKVGQIYFKELKHIIDNIWLLATGEDFRFPQTTGVRPLGIRLINKYVEQIHRATVHDEVVGGAFYKVLGLLAPPHTLFHPKILWRVLGRGLLG